MVVGVGSTGRKLPAFFRSPKNETPFEMSSAEPLEPSAAMTTPLNAAPAWVGAPLSATLPLYSGLGGARVVGCGGLCGGVVPDRHIAAVVVDPGTAGVLERGGHVTEGGHLVRGEEGHVRGGDRATQVENVGRVGLTLELFGGVDLILAGGVRLGGVHLDAVLFRESLENLAIVGPVRGQRDDVELALFLRR